MMYLCCDAIVGHQQITKIMKKVIAIIFTALLSLGSISAYGQKSYPADIFIYELDSVVTYKGKAPKITDFLEAFLAQDETSEVLWLLSQCWKTGIYDTRLIPTCVVTMAMRTIISITRCVIGTAPTASTKS